MKKDKIDKLVRKDKYYPIIYIIGCGIIVILLGTTDDIYEVISLIFGIIFIVYGIYYFLKTYYMNKKQEDLEKKGYDVSELEKDD